MKTSALRRKHVQLDQEKLNQTKHILGEKTETEALDRAFDVVVAEAEIDAVLKEARGKGVSARFFVEMHW